MIPRIPNLQAEENVKKGRIGIREVYVMLLSRMRAPMDKAQMAAVQILLENERRIHGIEDNVEEIIKEKISEKYKF